MPTKTFDTQDALVAALDVLRAAATEDTPAGPLAGWSLDFGLPSIRQEQHVWVDEQISEWTQTDQTTGLASVQEGFKLHVYVYVRKTGATALEVRNEIKAAGAAVEVAIGSQPFLGGAVMLAQVGGGEYDGAFADPEGKKREGVLHLIIECAAFIG